MKYERHLAAIAAALIAIVMGVTIVMVDDDGDGRADRIIIERAPTVPNTVGVDGPDRDAEPDTVLKLDREAREVAQKVQATPERYDMAGGLRGRDKAPVTPQVGPLATPSFPGCQTRILPANWSGSGYAKRAVGLHYTAGLNRPGLSDMNGLTAYASSSAAGVSWHFLIDAEGHCYYQVPLSSRAWTIGNLNGPTVNIEVIGTGREATYPAGAAGQRKLSQVVRRIAKVYGFPIRVGSVSNCQVTRPGIITHWQGGSCAGGHSDIRPYDLAREVSQIAAGARPPSKTAVAKCKTLVRVRRLRRAKRPVTRYQAVAAARARKQLAAGKYRCGERNGRMVIERR
jgi:hypothetical protein